MKEIDLPSGAKLTITEAPFADARELYQAMLEEIKNIDLRVDDNSELATLLFLKDFFCYGFSSKKIEQCLEKCFIKCLYNSGEGDFKIDKNTFEPVNAREDYLTVCMEVAKENILPFMKSLYAKYKPLIEKIKKDLV